MTNPDIRRNYTRLSYLSTKTQPHSQYHCNHCIEGTNAKKQTQQQVLYQYTTHLNH